MLDLQAGTPDGALRTSAIVGQPLWQKLECYVDAWVRGNLGENSGCGLVTKLCLTLVNICVHNRLLCPWDCSCKNTGVGFYFLFQEIFPTQESNPFLLHCM